MKNVHYHDEKFSKLSIEELLSYRDETPFHQQVVMCIDQHGVYTKNPGRPIIDPFLIDGILYFSRNPNSGQIYRLKRLQASLHFSNSIAVAHEIDFRIRFLIDGHKCIPKTLSVDDTQNVTIEERGLYVHNTDDPIPHHDVSNLPNNDTQAEANPSSNSTIANTSTDSNALVSENYSTNDRSLNPSTDEETEFDKELFSDEESSDDELDKRRKVAPPIKHVHNIEDPIPRLKPKRTPTKKSQPLQETRVHLEKAIKLGLLKNIEFTEKKRGATKKSPVMSFGWSQTNANQYSENRQTDTGATGPGLTNISIDLDPTIKEQLVKVMDVAMKSTPKGDNEYDIGPADSERAKYRRQFNECMGVNYDEHGKAISCEIKCEAFTIIIPLVLSAHRDVMNDDLKDMDSVIQINHSFSMSKLAEFLSEDLIKWLKENGVEDLFPVSIILYSRKVVAHITKKIDETRSFSTNPKLPSPFRHKNVTIYCNQQDLQQDDLKKSLKEGFGVLCDCINMAFFDTVSMRSTVNTLERNGVINPLSLKQTIRCFELKQEHLYNLIKHDEYENLIWKHTTLSKMKKKQYKSFPEPLKEVYTQIMQNNFANDSNPEPINKRGRSIVAFLNRGARVQDMRKRRGAFKLKNSYSVNRPRSKIMNDDLSTFKDKLTTYQLKDLYLDYAKYMEPSKIFHLHMLKHDYPVLESDKNEDDYVDLAMGKTFMFDRIAMAKEYAHEMDYVKYDRDDDDDDDDDDDAADDVPMRYDGSVQSDRYFSWRDADIYPGNLNMELARIIPDPTETFNGPYFQIPCAWDKLVSNTNIKL